MPLLSRKAGPVAAAVLIAIAAVLAARGGGGDDEAGEVGAPLPRIVDESDLTDREGSLGHEVYWAGERPPAQLELEQVGGNVYLRYLPPGVEAGDPRATLLTVGTYPVADPVGALRSVAAEEGGELESTVGGGFVLVNPSSEGSVYLAYPGSDLQIEVYDPAPGRALELIRSGAIRPVG